MSFEYHYCQKDAVFFDRVASWEEGDRVFVRLVCPACGDVTVLSDDIVRPARR